MAKGRTTITRTPQDTNPAVRCLFMFFRLRADNPFDLSVD